MLTAMVRALALYQCGLGFIFRCRCHMLVKFVVGSFLCCGRFFSRYFGFSLSSKTNTSNSNSIWKGRTRLNEFLRTIKCFVGKQMTIFFSYPLIWSHACAQLGRQAWTHSPRAGIFFLSICSADQKDKGCENENGLNRLDIWDLISIFAVCSSRVLFLECILVS